MTDYKKYEMILLRLALGKKQSEIVDICKCSYGTISRAKKWAENGKIRAIRNKSFSERVKELIKIPLRDPEIIPDKNLEANIDFLDKLSDKYMPINSSSSENSSEFPIDINFDLDPEIVYNSRFLSWMGAVLEIPKYWDLSKNSLKNKIIEKINKI